MESGPSRFPPQELLDRYLRVAPLSRALIRSRELEYFISADFGSRLLDLGHGDGVFAREAGRCGVKIFVALDRSIDELRRARARGSCRHYVVADMEKLPFRGEAFTGAMSNCVLEHIDEIRPCLDETLRVIKPGGIYVATAVTDRYEPLLFWPRTFRRFGLKAAAERYLAYIRTSFKHERYFTPEEWTRTATVSGFRVEKTDFYVGALRQGLMDLFLPFVLISRWMERLSGSAAFPRRRWPAGLISRLLQSERRFSGPARFANIALYLRKPSPDRRP